MQPLDLPFSPSGRLAQAGGEDRYRLGPELARGGMGVVFEAHDEILDRPVALKVLLAPPESRLDLVRRFIREAKIAAQLQHPGIPAVYEMGWLLDGRPFLAMKLIRGQMLSQLLANCQTDRARLLLIFEQLCQTVAYAHSQRIIHRDLKPSNVMVGSFGEVQLVDWGLARGLGEPPGSDERPSDSPIRSGVVSPHSPVTHTDQFVGTPIYTAPERLRGEVGDCRSDVYALGAILHELLTGKPPLWSDRLLMTRLIPGGTGMESLRASGADPVLIELTERCLALDPEQRPADASELAHTLQQYHERLAEQLRQLENEKIAQRIRQEERRRRHRVIALVGSLALLVVAGLGGLLWYQNQQRQRRDLMARLFLDKMAQATAEAFQRKDWDQIIAVLEPSLPQFDLYDRTGVACQRAKEMLNTAKLVKELEQLRRQGRLISTRERRVRLSPVLYEETFRKFGWNILEESADALAGLLKVHPAQQELLNGLYAWKSAERDSERWRKLVAVLQAGDSDPWRQAYLSLNQPLTPDQARQLAQELPDTPQPSELMIGLARALDEVVPGQGLRLRRALQQRFPDDFWYNLDLAMLLSELPATQQEALSYARIAVALRPDEAIAWNNLGVTQLLCGDRSGALQSLARAVQHWPDRGSLRLNYALALLHNGQYAQAAQELQRGQELAPELIEGEYIRGVLALRQGNAAEARRAMLKVWHHPEASRYLRDNTLFLIEDLLPLDELQRQARERPSAGVFYALCYLHRKENNLQAAEQAIVQALRLAPSHAFLFLEAARVADRRQDLQAVLDRATQTLLLDPEWLGEILLLRSFSNYSKPLPGLETMAQRVQFRYPERPEGWILQALHEVQNNRFAAARAACRQALPYRESQASARLIQGVALERQGKLEAAQTAYFLSHALNPLDPRPLIGIATIWLQRRKPDEAETVFRVLAAKGTAPAQVVRGQIEVFLARGQTLPALRYLDENLPRFPKNVELIALRGVLAWQVGRNTEAEAWLSKALQLDPKHLPARVNLGQVLLTLNKVPEAFANFKQALAQAPDDAQIHQIYGLALLKHKQYAQAEPILQRAIQLDPQEPILRAALAGLFLETQRLEAAEKVLAQATQRQPQHAQLAAMYGQTLIMQHRYRQGVAELERARRLLPPSSPNLQRLDRQLYLARQLLQMESRLEAVLAGQVQPTLAETFDLIDLYAQAKRKPVEAARWAIRFFEENPHYRFAPQENVYLRAGLIALQAAQADPAQALRWRRQALTWLERQRRLWDTQAAQQLLTTATVNEFRRRAHECEEIQNLRRQLAQKQLPREQAEAWQRFLRLLHGPDTVPTEKQDPPLMLHVGDAEM